MNTTRDRLLFAALKAALFEEACNQEPFDVITNEEWTQLFELSSKQGVLALTWDGVQRLITAGVIPATSTPDRTLKLRWALNVEQVTKRYNRQKKLAQELADTFYQNGLSLHVLKGFAISDYYPIPEHRECGDLDCFLSANGSVEIPDSPYETGNIIAERLGAKVEREYYKHSHIYFKGYMVENHQYCTAIRGRKERKEFEKHLQHLLATEKGRKLNDSLLIQPSSQFNALFLTAHSFGHFLSEGIKMRHLLDWGLLLKSEQNNIDWNSFYAWCDRMHYTQFADALTAICVKYLGINISNHEIHTQSPFSEKVLEDILYQSHSLFNGRTSNMLIRLKLIRSRLFGGWKYRELYKKSALSEILEMGISFLIERKPHL